MMGLLALMLLIDARRCGRLPGLHGETLGDCVRGIEMVVGTIEMVASTIEMVANKIEMVDRKIEMVGAEYEMLASSLNVRASVVGAVRACVVVSTTALFHDVSSRDRLCASTCSQ